MKLVFFSTVALAIVSFANSATFPITGDNVNCRSGPGTSYGVKKVYKKGAQVSIACQISGTSVNGNSIWDKTGDGCYVADYYVKTGSTGFITTKCTATSPAPAPGKLPGPVTNDYTYKGKCSGVDPWMYYKCQCTSFVAWRINKRLGIKFHNRYKGQRWGNGNEWDDAARSSGVRVDSKPVPGCIAQTDKGGGGFGHVAWVTKVSGDKVTIEEYNYRTPKGYGTRTVPKSTFRYIHVKV